MADISTGVGVLSGAATGAKLGATIGSVIPVLGTGVGAVAGGIIGGVAGLFGSKSSAKTPAYQPLDISKVITDARETARTNLAQSIALEQEFRPGTAALRKTTDKALGDLASGQTPGISSRDTLLDLMGNDIASNPLLEESASRILSNLRLGGALGADVQQQAFKAALEKGGAAGISGSGAIRGLVARDLGLTSLGLENQRISQAQEAGKTMSALRLQDLATRGSITGAAANFDLSRIGTLAGLIDSRYLPSSGLDPGAIASLYVAENNAINQTGMDAAAINQASRNANLSAMLGLGTTVASGAFDKPVSAIASLFKAKPGTLGADYDPSNPYG